MPLEKVVSTIYTGTIVKNKQKTQIYANIKMNGGDRKSDENENVSSEGT